MTDIFNEGKAISVEWFYFKNPGDSIQGTYVNKILGLKDSFQNEQIVYELQTSRGLKRVGFRTTQRINKNMEYVKYGQIIGFKHMGMTKFHNRVLNKDQECKDIQVFADPKIVDKEWLEAHNGEPTVPTRVTEVDNPVETGPVSQDITPDAVPGWDDSSEGGEDSGFGDFDKPVPSADAPAPVVTPAPAKTLPAAALLLQIAELAKAKLGVMDPSKVKEAVMNATGLAFVPSNYQKIIDTLTIM